MKRKILPDNNSWNLDHVVCWIFLLGIDPSSGKQKKPVWICPKNNPNVYVLLWKYATPKFPKIVG